MRRRSLLTALSLVLAACTGSGADTTSTTATTTTSSTTPSTSTSPTSTTTTTQPATTTSEQPSTTTTTVAEETTTSTAGETTTTTNGEGDTTTTITTLAPPTSSSTTLAAGSIDPDLEPWAGVYRQPTGYDGYLQLRADGVARAGYDFAEMPFEGTWDYDTGTDSIVFRDLDIATDCAGAEGRYARDSAPGGNLTLTLIEDPCQGRVDFITQPGSPCRCFTWLPVLEPGGEEEDGA